MEKPDKRPPSLSEFDYFGDGPKNQDARGDITRDRLGLGGPSPGRLRLRLRRIQPRRLVSLGLTALVLTFACRMAWQFRDYAQYAFSPPRAPLLLGNVSEMTPNEVPHNAYVSLHGITEHRGLHARAVRGLTLHHDEYWYFRLMGSRGVFIETAPNAETFGPNTEVTVQGRALDPDEDPLYSALLKSYEDTFRTELRAHRRIIQVDLAPGTQRWRYIAAIGALAACAMGFLFNGWRLIKDVVRD